MSSRSTSSCSVGTVASRVVSLPSRDEAATGLKSPCHGRRWTNSPRMSPITRTPSGAAHATSIGVTRPAGRVTGERKERDMAVDRGRGGIGGITLGGILVIIGIIVAIVWSLWLGIIIALVGLIAFGGFARGKWY